MSYYLRPMLSDKDGALPSRSQDNRSRYNMDEDDRSPYKIDIFLSEKIYNPGDTIQGEVIFRLSRNLYCDLINVQIFGTVRVFWTDKQVGTGGYHTVPHEQKKILINETAALWSAEKKARKRPTEPSLDDIVRFSTSMVIRPRSGDFQGLEAGKHKFEFTFQLPKEGLYTSFDLKDCCGRVQYSISVQCFSYNRLVAKKKLIFPIVCLTDPTTNPEALMADSRKKRIDFSNPNDKEDTSQERGQYLEVELSTSKRCFVPGEALPVQVYINNRSGRSVKYSHLSIQQYVFCIATYPFTVSKDWFQDTLGVGLDVHKIPTGSIHKYVPKFNVPALIPDFEIDGCLSLRYALKLDIGFERLARTNNFGTKLKHIICTLTIPIFIGTNSITEEDLVQRPKFEEAIGSSPAPPSYSDISPAPPSYEECISKQHVTDEDQNPTNSGPLVDISDSDTSEDDKKNV